MIVLREIQQKDIPTIESLAQVPGMFNLPKDKDSIAERIELSNKSFKDGRRQKSESKYTFVAEDLTSHRVLATSMVAGQHGTKEVPHYYFQVDHEKKFSTAIGTGFIHGTLELGSINEGPSELGALVVEPQARNTDARVGRQISFVRFLYMARNRQRFQQEVLAELLPPLNKRGLSPLWEAIGRRFTNMDYWEADQLCAGNKEFIDSLFPSGKIYTTFLSAEARNSIGKVGKDTLPIFHMLQKIGFEYRSQVDPFDGGPHLWAKTQDILPIRDTRQYEFVPNKALDRSTPYMGLLTVPNQEEGKFRAVSAAVQIQNDLLTLQSPQLYRQLSDIFQGNLKDQIIFMPYYAAH